MSPILLLLIFAIELFIVIVNTVGAASINGLVRRLPPTSQPRNPRLPPKTPAPAHVTTGSY